MTTCFFFSFFAISFLQTKIGIKAIESLEAQTVGEGRAGNFAARAEPVYIHFQDIQLEAESFFDRAI